MGNQLVASRRNTSHPSQAERPAFWRAEGDSELGRLELSLLCEDFVPTVLQWVGFLTWQARGPACLCSAGARRSRQMDSPPALGQRRPAPRQGRSAALARVPGSGPPTLDSTSSSCDVRVAQLGPLLQLLKAGTQPGSDLLWGLRISGLRARVVPLRSPGPWYRVRLSYPRPTSASCGVREAQLGLLQPFPADGWRDLHWGGRAGDAI